MRLSLSSAAAPDAALAELLAACARRGFAGVELIAGHAHGIDSDTLVSEMEAAKSSLHDAGVEICGLSASSFSELDLDALAIAGAALGTPVIVRHDQFPGHLDQAAGRFSEPGAELLVSHPTDAAVVQELLERCDLGLAWEFRPEQDDPAEVARILAAAGARLRYVRLYGGGPESARQEGRGVGTLMARLTLARFTGPLVLTPSTLKYHYAWGAWLGRAGGWGCGSKHSDPTLVTLASAG